jgi:hypothetical protein
MRCNRPLGSAYGRVLTILLDGLRVPQIGKLKRARAVTEGFIDFDEQPLEQFGVIVVPVDGQFGLLGLRFLGCQPWAFTKL